MRSLLMLFVIVGAVSSFGCATITRGTTEVLVVETEPAGAEVSISPAGLTCRTPCSVELKRKHNQLVKIHKDGFEPIEVNIIPQISGAGGAGMAGNVLVGGLIGAAVDAGSGAMKDLKPNPIKVNLVPMPPASPAATSTAPQVSASTSVPPSETPPAVAADSSGGPR